MFAMVWLCVIAHLRVVGAKLGASCRLAQPWASGQIYAAARPAEARSTCRCPKRFPPRRSGDDRTRQVYSRVSGVPVQRERLCERAESLAGACGNVVRGHSHEQEPHIRAHVGVDASPLPCSGSDR